MPQNDEQVLPGKIRPLKSASAIAARIVREVARLDKDVPAGVQPLNPGFFKLEDIRHNAVAKKKAAKRAAPKGK